MKTFNYLTNTDGHSVLVNLAAISTIEFRTTGIADGEAVQIRFNNGHIIDVTESMTAIYDMLVGHDLA